MGVDFRPVSGFGLRLTRQEVEKALEKTGIECSHSDEPEKLAEHYNLADPAWIGDGLSGDVDYLFIAEQEFDTETGNITADPEDVAALKRMKKECELKQDLEFHEDLLMQ